MNHRRSLCGVVTALTGLKLAGASGVVGICRPDCYPPRGFFSVRDVSRTVTVLPRSNGMTTKNKIALLQGLREMTRRLRFR
jgi:hypothetical protein